MNTQDRLLKWHFTWQITKDVVSCRSCHASQLEADKGLSFKHCPDCRNADEVGDPWDELDRICQGAPQMQHG